eukprot:1157614-Pelagomonas_calceolata.AAC.2
MKGSIQVMRGAGLPIEMWLGTHWVTKACTPSVDPIACSDWTRNIQALKTRTIQASKVRDI